MLYKMKISALFYNNLINLKIINIYLIIILLQRLFLKCHLCKCNQTCNQEQIKDRKKFKNYKLLLIFFKIVPNTEIVLMRLRSFDSGAVTEPSIGMSHVFLIFSCILSGCCRRFAPYIKIISDKYSEFNSAFYYGK